MFVYWSDISSSVWDSGPAPGLWFPDQRRHGGEVHSQHSVSGDTTLVLLDICFCWKCWTCWFHLSCSELELGSLFVQTDICRIKPLQVTQSKQTNGKLYLLHILSLCSTCWATPPPPWPGPPTGAPTCPPSQPTSPPPPPTRCSATRGPSSRRTSSQDTWVDTVLI